MTVLWPALQATERAANFRNPGGASRWHTDLTHELQPAGITHLHNDTIPTVGGDTLWASGYAAYEKLSPDFRKIIDGKEAIYKSAHTYLDRNDPNAGPKHIERVHPIVRVHPATGWKSLFVNRSFTTKIVGLDKAESDVILNYLFDVYERVCLEPDCLYHLMLTIAERRHPTPFQMDSKDKCSLGQPVCSYLPVNTDRC